MALYGTSYSEFRTVRKEGDADTCDDTACYRDHAVMMTDTVTAKRYWISVTGGTVSCSGGRFDEVNGFGPYIRDRPSFIWENIQGWNISQIIFCFNIFHFRQFG